MKSGELAINARFLTQPTTGVQRVARELTRQIDRLLTAGEYRLPVRLLCEEGADTADLDLRSIVVEVVPGGRGHRWEQLLLPRAVRGARLLCLGNTAPMWSLATGQPVSVMIHDLSYRLFPEAYSRRYRTAHSLLLPFLLRRSDPVITVSETEKALLSGLVPGVRGQIVVAQNGGWREGTATRAMPGGESPFGSGYLLYVGSFSQRKNFGGALAVAIRMAREDGLPFLFVGSGGRILTPTDIAIPDDVADRIRFAGQVEDLDELAAIYAGARCLVFPSFYEASPLPPVEAMRFGCPVVGSAIPSMRERCGDAIEYCDPEDVDDIVAAVRRVVSDPVRAGQLVERGRTRTARFSWATQARTILDAVLAA